MPRLSRSKTADLSNKISQTTDKLNLSRSRSSLPSLDSPSKTKPLEKQEIVDVNPPSTTNKTSKGKRPKSDVGVPRKKARVTKTEDDSEAEDDSTTKDTAAQSSDAATKSSSSIMLSLTIII